jgi:hypothetical protein
MSTPEERSVRTITLAPLLPIAIGSGAASAQSQQQPVQVLNVPLPITGTVTASVQPDLFFPSSASAIFKSSYNRLGITGEFLNAR